MSQRFTKKRSRLTHQTMAKFKLEKIAAKQASDTKSSRYREVSSVTSPADVNLPIISLASTDTLPSLTL